MAYYSNIPLLKATIFSLFCILPACKNKSGEGSDNSSKVKFFKSFKPCDNAATQKSKTLCEFLLGPTRPSLIKKAHTIASEYAQIGPGEYEYPSESLIFMSLSLINSNVMSAEEILSLPLNFENYTIQDGYYPYRVDLLRSAFTHEKFNYEEQKHRPIDSNFDYTEEARKKIRGAEVSARIKPARIKSIKDLKPGDIIFGKKGVNGLDNRKRAFLFLEWNCPDKNFLCLEARVVDSFNPEWFRAARSPASDDPLVGKEATHIRKLTEEGEAGYVFDEGWRIP